jgi:uncharacterized protein YegP (UPF0339 family)
MKSGSRQRPGGWAKIADSGEGYWNEQDCPHGINLVKASSGAPVYKK